MAGGHDPRAVANLILDEGIARGVSFSNLKLQKLLFLSHALFLAQKGRPLVRGAFEAWQYGPVSRDVYDAFRRFRAAPITERACRRNPATGVVREIECPQDVDARATVARVVEFYGSWSAGELVDLTHAQDGPWDYVVKNSSLSANFGLRIPDRVILDRFKFLWFGKKRQNSRAVDPDEDYPLVA